MKKLYLFIGFGFISAATFWGFKDYQKSQIVSNYQLIQETLFVVDAMTGQDAVNTAKELRNTALASRKLSIGYSLLCGWIKASDKAQNEGKTLVESITTDKELLALRKKNKELEEELLIIKKATAYFAKEHLSKSTRESN